MSDPLRTDMPRPLDAASAGDRDAKIEQLLLTGLDHYFAAQYEQAIHVWTRALFLDRAHPRARAYIDRARSALAERQRQSEELLHSGTLAFHEGDGERARSLLLAAIDGGANPDAASALLDRLSRLEAATAATAGPAAPRVAARITLDRPAVRRTSTAWALSALMMAMIAGTVWFAVDWSQLQSVLADHDAAPRAAVVPASPETVPPPPGRGEITVARARALAAGGDLHDALDLLNGVAATDPQRLDADRLRADVQRQLLALSPLPPPLKDAHR